MRTKSTGGFTLIELLIVIAIIGILAAVLIPNLLNARERAFDTAAQTCLKELATAQEVAASQDPWNYNNTYVTVAGGVASVGGAVVNSCNNVTVGGAGANAAGDAFTYTAIRAPSTRTFTVSNGTGVTQVP